MGSEAIVLRAANPTHDEGLAFARYVDIASEGGFRRAFGRRFADIFATAFTMPGHDLSWEYTVFAERDGVIVGMILASTAEQHSHSSDLPLRQAPGNRVRRAMSMVFTRFFLRMIGSHSDGDFYVHFLAVDEGQRGRGVGSALLKFMEERARAGGSARFTIDVAARNTGAARLYGRYGLTFESVGPMGTLRSLFVRRMVKDL